MDNNTKLWTTVVGSHTWRMNRPDSDIDEFTAYIVPTVDILNGRNRGHGSHFKAKAEGTVDRHKHEIGLIVNELIDANVNHLIGVLSPVVSYQKDDELKRIKDLVLECGSSKACYRSINGLAYKNYKKYVIGHDTAREYPIEKKCNLICRTLLFGINILEGKGFIFTPVEKQTPEDVKKLMKQLDEAKEASTLPERVDEEPFRDYLFNIRMRQLEGNL